MIKLTGLWKRQNKNGEAYYFGKLGYSTTLLIFRNMFKRKDEDPDLIAYLGETKKIFLAAENEDDEVESL
jgi:hypothetical protein